MSAAHDVFHALRDELAAFLRRKLSHEDAADLTQETWLRWQARDAAAIRDPRTFLFTVALNLARDTVRRRVTHDTVPLDQIVEPPVAHDDPEAACLARQQLAAVRAALANLPAPVRHAFLLYRYDGLTHAEIADRLDISRKSVERYIQRGAAACLEAVRL